MAALTQWSGDPTLIVYAVRYALDHTAGAHAHLLAAQAVLANRHQLPIAARTRLVRDITDWLDSSLAQRVPPATRQVWEHVVDTLERCTPTRPAVSR